MNKFPYTKEDLDLYLRMVERETSKNKINVKYQGAPDMSQKLENMARYAINEYFERKNNVPSN